MDPIQTPKSYLEELSKRAKKSHVYTPHQLVGLELANILNDMKHKSLYMKLAKEHGGPALFQIAKSAVENHAIKNPAAYFMTLTKDLKKK